MSELPLEIHPHSHKLEVFVQTTHIKDLKASDVQDPDEVLPGLLGVQLLVDAGDHPQEHLLVDGLGQRAHCVVHLHRYSVIRTPMSQRLGCSCNPSKPLAHLLHSLAFGDILIADLDPGVAEGLEQVSRVQTLEISCLVRNCKNIVRLPNMTCRVHEFGWAFWPYVLLLKPSEGPFSTFSAVWLCLLLTLLLLELHVPIMHHSPCELIDGHSFIRRKAQNVNGTLVEERRPTLWKKTSNLRRRMCTLF